ncbi:MAG: cell envelope integrity protein TolA [Desulfohalobiaceae bacterium]|nr:cell envelope integrity protein TolA [Desulfohalobiaceae bacterium]
MKCISFVLAFFGLIFYPVLAFAANSLSGGDINEIGNVLLVFVVLSVVFEVALTPVFNSRFFLARFEGKGVKIPLTIVLALIVFWGYDLDIIKELLNALGHQTVDGDEIELSFGGQIVTAFLIAGGSDGVFRIFSRIGIRNPKERKEKSALEKSILAEKAQTEKTEAERTALQKEEALHRAEREKQEAERKIEEASAQGDVNAKNKAIEFRDSKERELNQVKGEKALAEQIMAKKSAKANQALTEQINAQKEAGLAS